MRSIYVILNSINIFIIVPLGAQTSTSPNFELTNALVRTPIYYSIGSSDNPCDRAKNYPLIELKPGKSTYATLTSKAPELLISTNNPTETRSESAVMLSQFTPNKTMFVQTELARDRTRITLVPQTGKYLGFGQSKTGRNLKNNVQKKDIKIGYISQPTLITTYTPPPECNAKTK